MYIEDLALNNLQGLICHKTNPIQTKPWASLFAFHIVLIPLEKICIPLDIGK